MKKLKKRLQGICTKDEEIEKEKPVVTPIPKKISAVVFALMVFNGMKLTMAFAYLPKLVEWFGVPNVDIGYWAGLLGSIVYIGRFLFSYLWGYISDTYGRKKTVMISASTLAFTSLLFGLSNNIWYAFVTRFLQGCSTGLLPICKSILKENCDDTNITVMMTIAMSAFVVGLAAGPGFAGFLAFPADLFPNVISQDSILGQYPALLPNLIIVVGLTFTVILTMFALPKDKPKSPTLIQDNSVKISLKDKIKNSKFIKVLRQKWCMVVCVLYMLLSLANTTLTEIFPMFAATDTKYGGLCYQPYDIGVTFLISSTSLLVIQFTVIIKATNKYGNKSVFVWSSILLGFVFPFLPYFGTVENKVARGIGIALYLIIVQAFMASGFLAVNIMLNNSVDDINIIGTANGVGTSLSSLARGFAPTIFGSIYAWSLKNVKGVEGNNNALGFPFNQYFVFMLLALTAFITGFIAMFIPKSLNKSQTNPLDLKTPPE